MATPQTIFMADTGSDPCAFKAEMIEKMVKWIEDHCNGQEAIIWKREFVYLGNAKGRTKNRYSVVAWWQNTGWKS